MKRLSALLFFVVLGAPLLIAQAAPDDTVVEEIIARVNNSIVTLADRVAVFSARPGRIRAIETVDLPRPRDVFRIRFDPRFGELHDKLWRYLEESVRGDIMVG